MTSPGKSAPVRHPHAQQVDAYDRWVRTYFASPDWAGYLLTFLFNQLPGNERAVLAQMQKEIDWFYGRLLTRIQRRPRSASAKPDLPVLIAAPDVPVAKWKKMLPLDDMTVNDGLHHHAMLLAPTANTRLRHGVDVEIAENEATYLGRHGKPRHIDVRPITDPAGDVVRYALKQIRRGRMSPDDILVLPKAPSELIPRAELRRG